MFGLPLELQILFVNVLGLVSTTLNWNWFKWDQQLEKISNVSVSQSDKLNVENIDWLKTILSWIVVTRFIIDRISLLAYVANIYTVVTRSRHNLLILWMVLSFLKDIILEVVVIIITFLLWHATKESFPTSLLVEFVVDKIISLSVISTGKWCTTLKWYMQLQRMAKIRKFTIIARKSIASIANMPGRVGRSLDDECLGIAIIRRGKYASLLNLDRHSEESFNRMNAKSLSTLTDDTSSTNGANGANGANGTNDYNSNDLSVAEKSMRMLNVTAEDVMDARARIQERSYWNEQETIKTPEVKKDVIKQLPLEKNEEETINSARNTQLTENNLAKIVNSTSRKEDSMECIPVKKKEEKGNGETILVDEKEQILTENQNDVSLKSENVTSDKVNHAKSTESHDIYESKKKREEKKEGVEKIVQCPSFQSMNARNTEAKPCASLIRKLEAKYCPVSVNRRKWIDRVDRKEYPYEVSTQLTPTSSSTSKKERYKILKISCGCHRALHNNSKNGKHVRSIGINGKNVDFDINRKEFESFRPIVNMQRSKIDKTAFKYSEVYRLKKQIQKWEESYGKHSRGSKSLAETARSSAYAKDVFDASDKLSVVNCRKSVQTETYDESRMMSDSMSERHRLKYKQKRSRRPVNLRSVHDVASFREMNYSEAREINMKALETNNNFTLENKRETKAKKRRDLLPANRKLSIEQREAIELKALKAYNELTLSEDKRELEVRKDRDSSLNHRRLTKESEVLKMKVLKTYNDSLLEDKKEMERTRTYNLSPSFQQSIDERSTSRVCNKLKQSGSKRELRTRRKRDSSRNETLSECEKVETPASVSNRPPISSCENTMISTRQNIHSNFGLNDRYARQARMSLNLWEITRNIEWTVHPRGIILINKNLQSQYLKNERFRESQQRDIVDDSTASTLHSAFFFKPEIVTRVFRRVHNQTRIDEFFSRFPTFLRQDFDMEFACQMNNEVVVRHWNSPLDCDLERMMGNDRNNLEEQFNVNDNSNTTSEHDHDLCIIVIDQEQVSNESQIAIEDSMTVETQENIENIQMTNILVFNENLNHVDNATNDNLPIQLITDALRNFNIETEGSIRDAALPIEECEDIAQLR
ncbi:hypothetical protein ALC56_09059 [Trachymyrmex septentrionalis]|uniref:Uncharacterized protein n=1 Tax=Trachymyrmex septentrionalis TaxID=34720 RepID=A0A151JVD0_9HYME|nr:PREDICTED: uncharacterized protein LOC108750913 isoform X2 [Trachymyrmex septentrionalis]KYN36572.1 hypothetical protein ALC56_09059 [Trachymyrmex septentrionalis]